MGVSGSSSEKPGSSGSRASRRPVSRPSTGVAPNCGRWPLPAWPPWPPPSACSHPPAVITSASPTGSGFRIGTVVLVVALAGYVMEKERHLRRLSTLLVNERVLGAALSNRLKELAVLYEAGKALNSVLVIDEVLQLILSSAFELLEASSGFIMLLEGPDNLVVSCRAGVVTEDGDRLELGEGIAGRVPAGPGAAAHPGDRVGEGPTSRRESAVCVPLIHRDRRPRCVDPEGGAGPCLQRARPAGRLVVRRACRHRRRQRPALRGRAGTECPAVPPGRPRPSDRRRQPGPRRRQDGACPGPGPPGANAPWGFCSSTWTISSSSTTSSATASGTSS